jgi:hypothetical protein
MFDLPLADGVVQTDNGSVAGRELIVRNVIKVMNLNCMNWMQ